MEGFVELDGSECSIRETPRAPFCAVYLIGNSHLAKHRGIGQNLHSYLHPNCFTEILAEGGAKVDRNFYSMLARMESREQDYPTLNHSYVIVMIGDNDLRQGFDPETIAEKIMTASERSIRRNPNLIVFVCGVLKSPSLSFRQVKAFNSKIRTECLNQNDSIIFVDLEALIFNVPEDIRINRERLFSERDGVHLTPEGETIVCKIFASIINPKVHEEFNCHAPKIRGPIKLKVDRDEEYLDYIRMKGIFRRDYTDIIDQERVIMPLYDDDLGETERVEELQILRIYESPMGGHKTVKLRKRKRDLDERIEKETKRTYRALDKPRYLSWKTRAAFGFETDTDTD